MPKKTHAAGLTPDTCTYARTDINDAYSRGYDDAANETYTTAYRDGADYARAEICAFLALGGTFRDIPMPGFFSRLHFAWLSLRDPVRMLRSANMRAGEYLTHQQEGELS